MDTTAYLRDAETTSPPSPTLISLMCGLRKTEPSDVRIRNRMLAFSTVFFHKNISRVQLSDLTQLSRVSISELVSSLKENHVLTESGHVQSSGRGKKGALISVDTEYWKIISLDLSEPYTITGTLVNIEGESLDSIDVAIEPPAHVTVGRVSDICSSFIEKYKDSHILGIGIAVPGIVSPDGVIIDSPSLGWSDIHLRAVLERQFALPVTVISESCAHTIVERFIARSPENTLLLDISSHVTSSLLIEDSLVLGSHHSAGSISHVVANPHGPLCSCGKRGCIDVVFSSSAIRRLFALGKDDTDTILSTVGEELGKTLALPCAILDTKALIINGPADIVNPIFLDAIERSLDSYLSHNASLHVSVHKSMNSTSTLQGVSIYVLQHALQNLF
ncbi:hypothetical protein B9G54_00500 [Alloscardovia macacae]|uniref:NagC family transcriptional regulator n=1 Tax=Alloscardovia macacae TaxID=1160091 RepID=A0A1Y2SZR2_9BIFI|nr:ROK family protein [Alloscardovia macacae]OTA27589.1 hypothetical protein B9G54_00500 [Alloscardovia macacae]OTA30235.1 hypothetical protein B9T39_00580 [Alloscardovia macacae]